MYENYTYEQIKALSDDQKIEALKELKVLYPENKALAQHLDVKPVVTSNLVKKYVEGKQVGRKKMTEEEKAQKKTERELQKQQEQEKQKKQEMIQQQEKTEIQDEEQEEQEIKNEISNIVSHFDLSENQLKNSSFNIQLNKSMIGEEVIARLNGIANSLLKENEYKIELNIEEIEED